MTKRAALSCLVLVYSLILVFPLAQVSVAQSANELVTHTVVAASGDAAPAGGSYMTFFRVALNMRSQIAFDVSLGGPSTTGVFVADRGTTSAVALGGNPDPAAANGANGSGYRRQGTHAISGHLRAVRDERTRHRLDRDLWTENDGRCLLTLKA